MPDMTVIDKQHQLDNRHAGRRFDQVAAQLFDDYSRAQLQSWIRAGDLTLDGCVVSKPNQRIAGHELMRLHTELKAHSDDQPQAIPLDVAYQDEHLLIINKPAGLVVHPGSGNPDGTLVNALLHLDAELNKLPRAGIVHRLDKDTSGVLVIARTDPVRQQLIEMLKQRDIHRHYLALVWGHPEVMGSVDLPLGRHPVDRVRMAVRPEHASNAKPAVTHFRHLQQFRHCTLLAVQLETGRTHQIRVHLSHLGFPLIGDPMYRQHRPQPLPETATLSEFPRQALHAERLQFKHPASGELVDVQIPPPADMQQLILHAESL